MESLPYGRVETFLEQGVAQQCAPVLMGVKPAGMFNVVRYHQVGAHPCGKPIMAQAAREQIELAVERADAALRETGVRLRVMAHRKGSSMVFVWRPALMRAFIGRDPEATMLEVEGYNVNDDKACVDRLQTRVLSFDSRPRNPDGTDRFPHEVGFLLGYPLDDVMGFVRTRAAALARGWWNVYSDVARAQRVFRTYDACVALADQRLCEGDTLTGLSGGAANMAANRALALYR